MTKIGINGFGRIGRFVFRASTKRNDIEVVAINDLLPVDYMAYMLKYDTMHGAFEGSVDFDLEKSLLIVNGKAIRVTACRDPKEINWGAVGAEYVVESTGLFLTKEKAQGHIEAGAKYVVMSAPSKDDTPMFVCGVNADTYKKGTQFVSNASCTTNCLAPIAKVLNLHSRAVLLHEGLELFGQSGDLLFGQSAVHDENDLIVCGNLSHSWLHLLLD